jgi:hypothetical protein
LAEFGLKPKPVQLKLKTSSQQKASKKELLEDSKSNYLKPNEDKCTGSFEPSNIIYTRNSSFWRLRNLKAWFKEQESYEDPRYLKAYAVEM